MNGIFIISYSIDYDYAYGSLSLVCDGQKCLIRNKYNEEQELNEHKGYALFELNDQRKAAFERIAPLLQFYTQNSEHMLPESYETVKAAFLPKNYGKAAFDLNSSVDEHLKNASSFDEDELLPLLSLFLPVEVLPHSKEYYERYDAEEIARRIADEMKTRPEKKKKTRETVFLGEYPQEMVKDEALINELNARYADSFKDMKSICCEEADGYCAADYDGCYMLWYDAFTGEDSYRAVIIREYRPIEADGTIGRNTGSPQEQSGFEKNKIYWFKYQPIEWTGFKTQGGYRLISNKVLDAEPMCDRMVHQLGHDDFVYSEDSLFPEWLWRRFSGAAFWEALEYLYEDRITDAKIPSVEEFREFFPKKAQRVPEPTDYALIKGYLRGESYEAVMGLKEFVWTSTYIDGYSNRMAAIAADGTIVNHNTENIGFLTLTTGGVRPMLTVRGKLPPG